MVPVSAGGTIAGERGEFGRWDKVLARIEDGESGIVKAGSRHNALLTWIGQMCNARLALETVRTNFRMLAARAFEKSYADDDKRDYETLLRGIDEFYEKIDAELNAVDAEVEQGLVEDGVEAAERASAIFDFGPQPQGPIALAQFAQQCARRISGESEEHWLSWLGACLNGANLFDSPDYGTIVYVCRALQRRLEFVGAVRQGQIYAPLSSPDATKITWSMSPLSFSQAQLLVRHLFFSASELLHDKETRTKVNALPAVQREQRGKRKPKTLFAAKGELLSQMEREMTIRIKARMLQSNETKKRERELAFQNGIFNLEKWEKICEESIEPWDADPASGLLGRIFEPWQRNPEVNSGTLNPAVSWIACENCSACSLGVPTGYLNGNFEKLWVSHCGTEALAGGGVTDGDVADRGELSTPLFDGFLHDCFGADPAAVRGVLQIIAYCLLPDNPLQRYFFFEGIAGAGKGTLATLISLLVGEQNTGLVELERLKSDAWLGPLEGKSLVILDEAENNDPRLMRRVMHELARVTGSSRVSARSLHADARPIRANWRFILIANSMPDAADKSGQQARRAVPLYFGFPKRTGVVRELAKQIYAAEGDKIATKAVIEYLTRGFPRGEAIFEVESPAFQTGKQRFDESTGGLRRILKVFRPGDKNMPKMFVEAICEIWTSRKEGREYMLKNLDRTVTGEMTVLGFAFNERLRMPWPGAGGESDRLAGFQSCAVDTAALLAELEMMPDELLAEIRDRTRRRKKLWFSARAVLELSDREFDTAEGREPGQRDLFE
jgi:hypothetical protein